LCIELDRERQVLLVAGSGRPGGQILEFRRGFLPGQDVRRRYRAEARGQNQDTPDRVGEDGDCHVMRELPETCCEDESGE